MQLKSLMVLLGCMLLFSCSKEESGITIEEYLVSKGIDAEKSPEGFYYIIEKEGEQLRPNLGSNVTVHYNGYLTDGTMFESSYENGKPISVSLWNVIEGWQKGIPLFGIGGKGRLFIPPSLGYGDKVKKGSSVPKNAILIFDIELVDFK